MHEHPIIFSAPMVRAILEGRKTQTRRVVKARHFPKLERFLGGALDGKWNLIPLPYGQPGDRLWVRETFAHWSARDIFSGAPTPVTVYRAGRQWRNGNCPGYEKGELFWKSPDDKPADVKWKPSIHMPRWASRITLEITDVRVQRVQDISEEDAIAEGIRELPPQECLSGERRFADPLGNQSLQYLKARAAFAMLWDSINAKRGFGWNANPYVWALTFKMLEHEGVYLCGDTAAPAATLHLGRRGSRSR